MGWQKRSSGIRYESYIRHVFIIGGIIKTIIRMALYSKACQKCDSAENIREEAEEREFPKNFEGRSKIMEASANMKMVEDSFNNLFLSLSSTITSMIKINY